ncbi:transcription-repair coupling factor [Candidatus Cryosericum terrychapinii]|uniref:Transcription-repair-coupling factor n=1 Tax=Candidatus Cryosericum terrychapinii TaxID=2290919 RepID=A0A398D0S6_9BACT|nr:transcription-repair coupling factor [Candidatus Cryosericum terrychapinii]RIE06348.1 transcription-repair coupling factor [Candidatus Cryosericum terrychapinii]
MQSGSFDLLLQQAQASAPELFARFAQLLEQPGSITVSSPSSGYRQLLLAALVTICPRPVVVVCPSIDRAEELSSMVRGISGAIAGMRPFVVLPELGVELMEYTQYSRPLSFVRARALDQIYARGETVVFTTAQGLIDPSLPARDFTELASALTVGDRIIPHSLARRLLQMGYEGVSSVTEMSQFSMRGNVFDLYSQAGEYPARIVLEGNVISRIKLFDPVTQQSVEPVSSVGILPPYPILLDREARQSFSTMAAERWKKEHETREGSEEQDATFLEDLESFISTTNSKGVNYFLYQYADPERMCGSLARLLGSHAIAVFADVDPEAELTQIFDSARELYQRTIQAGFAPSSSALDQVEQIARRVLGGFARSIHLTATSARDALTPASRELPPLTLSGSFSEYLGLHAPGETAIDVVSWNPDKARHLVMDTVEDLDVMARLAVVKGSLSAGFAAEGFMVLTDRELFPRATMSPKKTTRFSQAISRLEDLHEGDYVVHRDYGIGVFMGMNALTVDGVTRDYISLEYKDHSLLHVPVERLGYLEKYVGDRTEITLDEPGSRKWKRARKEAAEDARRIAHELLETAAKRHAREGYMFKPNPELEVPVVDAFAYELTPDQSKAIADVLSDMEAGKPMDRLVCGDVGFGKTEVAIRAAARAVANGKQVAIVAPTTILAMQHFRNLEARFEPIGYKVALFSRMVGSRELAAGRKLLHEGGVDIAVGTHKVLNMAGDFKDIGLMIVDEEQLFGVLDKEKIKKMKTEVDVLTLSATPIPRTLESSIVGIRDISLINTPPVGRYPIRTFLMPFDEEQLTRAVRAELERHGQVYFVHNRIMDIEARFALLARLFPEARIAVAHGQLRSEVLEQIMLDFYEGKYDILVSTTIIEAGLDFPNVNTIIVDEGERLGLAQLYQLRGRVGRAQRHAYAYIFYSHGVMRESVAFKRLEAIASAVDFGAGLQVALKDLELRGAGDVLGVKQSGRFSDVGYHMFLSMVEEEIMRVRGQYSEPVAKLVIILGISAFIPETYVADSGERLALYNAVERAGGQDLTALEERTIDRYGALPPEVAGIFALKRLELSLIPLGVSSLKESGHALVLEFVSEEAATRFLRAHVDQVAHARTVRDSVVLPMNAGQKPLSLLSSLLSGSETVH